MENCETLCKFIDNCETLEKSMENCETLGKFIDNCETLKNPWKLGFWLKLTLSLPITYVAHIL